MAHLPAIDFPKTELLVSGRGILKNPTNNQASAMNVPTSVFGAKKDSIDGLVIHLFFCRGNI